MGEEAEVRLHKLFEREAYLSSSRTLSFASASDVSFQFSEGSLSDTEEFDDDEDDDDDITRRKMQSECEEIPSFRWIPWWPRRKRSRKSKKSCAEGAAGVGEEPKPAGGTEAECRWNMRTRLVHFDDHLEAVTLEDLMESPAQVLGRGSCGTVYRAMLEDGSEVAVKRLKGETASEFETEVNALGKIRHPNLMALRSYYYWPEGEKVLVFDYMPKGNLSAFLQGRLKFVTRIMGSTREGPTKIIDWATRMNIALGITRGLHYLHTQKNMVHGNLTSRNVLLDDHYAAKITDYALSRLTTSATNSNVADMSGASGFRAPELSELKEANTKTDVYSLGLIMLELLTGGESPSDLDLLQWVTTSVEEEEDRILEMVDLDLMGDAMGTTREKLFNTTKLALHCVDSSPDARPEVQEVLQQLEEISKSELPRATGATTTKGGSRPTDEDTGIVTETSSSSLDMAEERTAPPVEDVEVGTSETSNILASDENPRALTTEKIIPSPSISPASCPEASQLEGHNGASFSSLNIAEKATAEAKSGETTRSTKGTNATSTLVSPLSRIDWANVSIEVGLQVPTSPPLIKSHPDLIYQRYFQTLYDLAHRSPPLPYNVLEVQLNTMIMGLQSMGYPLDQWLKAATRVLVFAKKRERIEQHVDDYKVRVEVQLKEVTSTIAPAKEEISRTRSDVTHLEKKQEELDETIGKLEDQLTALKTQQEEVIDSLTMARDRLVEAEIKMESVVVDMDCLNQQFSAISELRSSMLHELLPSRGEAFDSSFQEIMTKKF